MVLHNNKWDRKAKIQYQKKHGIQAPKVETKPSKKWSRENGGQDEHTQNSDQAHSQSDSQDDSQNDSQDESQPFSPGDSHNDSPATHQVAPLEELDFEVAPSYQDPSDAVAQHIASFNLPPKQSKLPSLAQSEEFRKLEDGIAAHKLKSEIQRRFGKASYKLEEDEDDFWESMQAGPAGSPGLAGSAKPEKPAKAPLNRPTVGSTNTASIDPSKETWLDNLIG